MRHAPILIALAVATVARADSERTLHLSVHGSLDSAVVAASIAKELGLEVAVVDGTCDVPCLDVTIDGKNAATVVFSPRTGAPRQRTITIGTDTSQWPLVITLLAGNVVRDESQDVLAGLPARDLRRPEPADLALPAPPEAAEDPDDPDDPDDEDAPDPTSAPTDSGSVIEPVPPDSGIDGDPPDAVPIAPGQQPAGPAGADPALAAPAPEPPREHRWLELGFVPGLSTDLTRIGSVRHFLSFDLLVGLSGGSSGLTVSGIADIERGLVAGFQLGGVVAVARQVAGIQVAGVAAVAGDLDGVQVAGTAAVADRIDGFQVGGVAAVSRSSADYQAGGIAAVARGHAGAQVAGIAVVAGTDANLQVGGVTSVSRGTANIQVAGVVNVARRLRGVQLAPINVAREVDGIQIGVINVGGSADGFSFGLINIVPGGRYDVEAAVDSDRIGTVLFRHGGRRWHNVYGVGGHSVKETGPSNDDVWMYALGFGPSLAFDNTVIDLEAIGWQVNHGPRHESDVSILGQLRLSIAHHWGPFAIVAGGVLNAYVTNDQLSPLFVERTTGPTTMDKHVTVTTWPSVFLGVRL